MTATLTEAPMALPRLDYTTEQAKREAESRVRRALDTIPSSTKGLDRHIAVAKAMHALTEDTSQRDYRNALILSLVIHDGHSALNVANAAGLSRSWMSKYLNRMLGGDGTFRLTESTEDGWRPADDRINEAKAKVRYHRNAARELPMVAKDCLRVDALIKAAREPRNEATLALAKAGMTQQGIADATGQRRETIKHMLLANGVQSRTRRTPEQIAKDTAAAEESDQ